MTAVKIQEIQTQTIRFTIVGTSPMIQHAWSEKALKSIRDKQAGKKTKVRDVRDPVAEGKAAAYCTEDGRPAVPGMAVKAAIIAAAHKDLGVEKTLVRKALFLVCDSSMMLPMECSDPVIREDCVRVGAGSTDLRYRPEFTDWSVEVTFQIDAALLRPEDVVNLVDRAGFGVGIGEWRPEKGGEYGRFQVDTERGVEVLK